MTVWTPLRQRRGAIQHAALLIWFVQVLSCVMMALGGVAPRSCSPTSQQEQRSTGHGQHPGQCAWQHRLNSHTGRERMIVRFKEWKLADEHAMKLSAHVPSEGAAWRWVDRQNAAAAYPTDFGLMDVLPLHKDDVVALLGKVPGVKDVHADKRLTRTLKWEPEQPAPSDASASVQVHPDGHVAVDAELLQGLGEDASGLDPAALSVLRVTKPSGRFRTSFMMDGPEQPDEEAEQPAPITGSQPQQAAGSTSGTTGASAGASGSGQQPGQAASDGVAQGAHDSSHLHTGHDRHLMGVDSAGERLDAPSLHHTARGGTAWSAPRLDARPNPSHTRRLSAHHHAHGSRRPLTVALSADKIWAEGSTGAGVTVGVFDTGIRADHPHIRRIKERTNWTHQNSLADGLGHGTFVAGVIASQFEECPGLAPDVDMITFKVFTDDQVSFTSWFLDAFNYAMLAGVNVINLSIGGPDFLDAPFVEKVWEITSNGILMVSAIGNDGPLYGTLNNPADQNDVIGVGGIDDFDAISGFSSRGMTSWELTLGSGRVKPDIMAYSKDVHGSKIHTGCKTLSGTSVASPVAAGAVCLLASTVPAEQRWQVLNPASMKQALIEGAHRLPGLNMYEQGAGRLDLIAAKAILHEYQPRASVVPAAVDLTDATYMWPYGRQPLYAGALPVIVNATVLNALGVSGTFEGPPVFYAEDEGGSYLHISFEYSEVLWPWSGYLALFIRVRPAAATWSGTAAGSVVFTVTSPPGPGETQPRSSTVVMPVRARIEPTPPREKRVIWDQFHSIKYPPGYMPRDNLDIKHDILDWHGDSPWTNFHATYDALRDAGYFLEVLSGPATCFNATGYGAYLVVDPEDEWYTEEISKLASDVANTGLALIVFAEWYHVDSLAQMRFYDDNTRSWWTPVTGGANVPALNDLLAPYNISLGDSIVHGTAQLAGMRLQIAHGADIAALPPGSYVATAPLASMSSKSASGEYAYYSVTPVGSHGGHVVVYADSNCLDSSHQVAPCYDLLVKTLDRVVGGQDNGLAPAGERQASAWAKAPPQRPVVRRADVNFTDFSFVLRHPHRCYGCSHCDVGGPAVAHHCREFLDTTARTARLTKTLLSSTTVYIPYSGGLATGTQAGSNITSGGAGGQPSDPLPAHLHPQHHRPGVIHLGGDVGLALQPGGAGGPASRGSTMTIVVVICVVGLVGVMAIWHRSVTKGPKGSARMDRERRRSSFANVPI